jgi:hypothetical protein
MSLQARHVEHTRARGLPLVRATQEIPHPMRTVIPLRPWQAAVLLAAGLGCALNAAAQAAPPKPFTPGDVFIDANGDTLQVLRCKGAGWQTECQLRRLQASGKAPIDPSAPRWWSLDTLRGSERGWIEFQGNPPYAGPPVALPAMPQDAPAAAPSPAAAAAVRPATASQALQAGLAPTAAAGGECPRTPYGGPVPGNTAASEALFKRKVADNYTMATRAPYWYGVTFEKFSVGSSQRNAVSNVAGRATRVNEGAPPNVTMYPVSSVHVVCEQSPGQAERRRVESRYLCFVSANNEWTCGGDGVPTITQLRRP